MHGCAQRRGSNARAMTVRLRESRWLPVYMAGPPRLSAIRLRWENSIIYFVTMCVKDRRKVLATPKVFEATKSAIGQLKKWRVLAGVIMPDHVHWVISPVEDRELSVGDFSHGIKRTLRKWL